MFECGMFISEMLSALMLDTAKLITGITIYLKPVLTLADARTLSISRVCSEQSEKMKIPREQQFSGWNRFVDATGQKVMARLVTERNLKATETQMTPFYNQDMQKSLSQSINRQNPKADGLQQQKTTPKLNLRTLETQYHQVLMSLDFCSHIKMVGSEFAMTTLKDGSILPSINS